MSNLSFSQNDILENCILGHDTYPKSYILQWETCDRLQRPRHSHKPCSSDESINEYLPGCDHYWGIRTLVHVVFIARHLAFTSLFPLYTISMFPCYLPLRNNSLLVSQINSKCNSFIGILYSALGARLSSLRKVVPKRLGIELLRIFRLSFFTLSEQQRLVGVFSLISFV